MGGTGRGEVGGFWLRSVAEYLPVGLLYSRGDEITFMNAAALRMLGVRTVEEVRSRTLLDFLDPASQALAQARGERLIAMNEPQPLVRHRLLRDDGSTLEIEEVSVPFDDE